MLTYIAANIRRHRMKLGLTQTMLAEAANLDMRFVQKVESASSNIAIWVLLQLADALGVPPAVLMRPAVMPAPMRGRPMRSSTDPNSLPVGRRPRTPAKKRSKP
jgi:transcriptional regulator with XRE-family HTH domain